MSRETRRIPVEFTESPDDDYHTAEDLSRRNWDTQILRIDEGFFDVNTLEMPAFSGEINEDVIEMLRDGEYESVEEVSHEPELISFHISQAEHAGKAMASNFVELKKYLGVSEDVQFDITKPDSWPHPALLEHEILRGKVGYANNIRQESQERVGGDADSQHNVQSVFVRRAELEYAQYATDYNYFLAKTVSKFNSEKGSELFENLVQESSSEALQAKQIAYQVAWDRSQGDIRKRARLVRDVAQKFSHTQERLEENPLASDQDKADAAGALAQVKGVEASILQQKQDLFSEVSVGSFEAPKTQQNPGLTMRVEGFPAAAKQERIGVQAEISSSVYAQKRELLRALYPNEQEMSNQKDASGRYVGSEMWRQYGEYETRTDIAQSMLRIATNSSKEHADKLLNTQDRDQAYREYDAARDFYRKKRIASTKTELEYGYWVAERAYQADREKGVEEYAKVAKNNLEAVSGLYGEARRFADVLSLSSSEIFEKFNMTSEEMQVEVQKHMKSIAENAWAHLETLRHNRVLGEKTPEMVFALRNYQDILSMQQDVNKAVLDSQFDYLMEERGYDGIIDASRLDAAYRPPIAVSRATGLALEKLAERSRDPEVLYEFSQTYAQEQFTAQKQQLELQRQPLNAELEKHRAERDKLQLLQKQLREMMGNLGFDAQTADWGEKHAEGSVGKFFGKVSDVMNRRFGMSVFAGELRKGGLADHSDTVSNLLSEPGLISSQVADILRKDSIGRFESGTVVNALVDLDAQLESQIAAADAQFDRALENIVALEVDFDEVQREVSQNLDQYRQQLGL